MPISDTDIANKALISIGHRPVASINSAASDVGLAVKTLYPLERDAMLRRWRWNFALAWAALTQLATAPLNLDLIQAPDGRGSVTFSAAYALPQDFLRLSRFSPRGARWRIVGNAIYTDAIAATPNVAINGTQPPNADGADNLPVVTNASGATPGVIGFEYVQRVIDPNRFDPLFIDCFSSKLAMELAFGITGLADQQDRARANWQIKQLEAESACGNENWPDALYDSSVADARFGYGGGSDGLTVFNS